MPTPVELRSGDARCILYPAIGGSIAGWNIGDQHMLRWASDEDVAAADPLKMGSFPLVPYSNRIGHGQFDWGGSTIAIAPNFPPEPHAIHGVGWKAAWQISELSEQQCTLALAHAANDDWPWSFSATQQIALREDRLELTLTAVNNSDRATPLAFGHHPYFDQDGAYMLFGAERLLLSGDDGLPTMAVPPEGIFDFSAGEPVEGRDIDHCYAGWGGETRILWEGRQLGLIIRSAMEAAVVYIPSKGNAFCFEPVPHVNNALNRSGDSPAMPVIEPGDSYSSCISMMAVAAEDI
jgi:aldose 1-epimerase